MMLHKLCIGRKPEHETLCFSRSTKPCVFLYKVAVAGDERYFVCPAVAAGVVWLFLCILEECLFLGA